MKTDQVARHYGTLSAWERFSLLAAARVRGDDVEATRLIRSAPQAEWRMPHHQPFAEAVCEVAMLHLLRLLDDVALLWRADSAYVAVQSCGESGPAHDARELGLLARMRRLATRLEVVQKGWRQFCKDLRIDPELLLRDLPGYETARSTLEMAKTLALSAAEVAAVAEIGGSEPTVAGVLADYRAGLASRTGIEPPPG